MWDERYATPDYAYGTEPNDFLKESCHKIPAHSGSKVLCLAEGEGRNAVFLAEQGFEVTAVDLSSVGLKKAQELAKSRQVSIQTEVANLADYDLGEAQWDAIISIWCHVPPQLRASLHQKVEQALKPGGVLILEAYRPDQIHLGTGGPQNAELTMSLDSLKAELPRLEHEYLCEVDRDVAEGKFHLGKSAVVQLIARKPA